MLLGQDPNAQAYQHLVETVHVLRRVWQLTDTRDGYLDLASLLDALSSRGRGQNPFEKLCDGAADASRIAPIRTTWNALGTQLGSLGPYRPLVVAVSRGDYRQVAHHVITLLFDNFSDDCNSKDTGNLGADCRRTVYRRFAEALVIYFVEPADGGSAYSSREAFRSAAEDVVRDLAVGGGIDRAATWAHRALPDLELQANWSKGYQVAGLDGGDQFRYTAALRMLSLRPCWYTKSHYIALHASLIDLLAPFSEMAGRRTDVTYTNTHKLVWNIFSPRLELVYGSPRLSKHVLIGVGATLYKPFAPVYSGSVEGRAEVTYETLGGRTNDYYRFMEAGAFAKFKI